MGLGSYWGEVLDVLQEIIPVYDKVNSYISLGKDSEHRSRAMKGKIQNGDKILDAGSGFGNMSKTALDAVNGEVEIMLYDPLLPMIKKFQNLHQFSAKFFSRNCNYISTQEQKQNTSNSIPHFQSLVLLYLLLRVTFSLLY